MQAKQPQSRCPKVRLEALTDGIFAVAMLLISSLVCAVWSLVDPRQAIWAYALHLATPSVLRFAAARKQFAA